MRLKPTFVASGILKERRIFYNQCAVIDDFISEYKPSVIPINVADWIQCNNNDCAPSGLQEFTINDYAHILGPIALIPRKTSIIKRAAIKDILSVATQRSDTAGKWMLYCTHENIDRVWETVCRATIQGKLGFSSKVATFNPNQKMYLICVYCLNFNDKFDLERVLQGLKKLGLVVKCGFKPDIFTKIGLYTKNEYKLPVVIYSGDCGDDDILHKVFPK
jgi:hypothetical protein